MKNISDLSIKIEDGETIIYITTTDNNENDRYILLKYNLLLDEKHYRYAIKHI